jgi:hypothetical protein
MRSSPATASNTSRTTAALRAWWDILKVGGHLCLYLPHRDLYPNIGSDGANPDHKHDFVPEDIIAGDGRHGRHFDVMECEVRDDGASTASCWWSRSWSPHDGEYTYRQPRSPRQPRPCAWCATAASAT